MFVGFLVWLALTTIVSGIGIVYRQESGQYVLVHENKNVYHKLADGETAESLAFLQSSIATIESKKLESYKVGADIPHCAFPPNNGWPTPDDALEVVIMRFTYLQPNDHVVRISGLKDVVNPSIIRIRDKILMTYCPPVWHPLRSTMFFGWLNETSRFEYSFDPSETYFHINNSLHIAPNTDWNVIQQDSRLLLLHQSSISDPTIAYDVILTYSSGTKFGCQFYYCHIRFSHPKGGVVGSGSPELTGSLLPSVELHTEWGGAYQKNWVNFQYKNKLLFIETLNPMKVLEVVEESSRPGNISIKAVYSQEAVHLPWNDIFPSSIRGGTNAIPVRHVVNMSSGSTQSSDYFLSFFHSKDKISRYYQMSSYFLGALTLCPHPPFNIHSMSRVPITVDEWLYTGKWLTNAVNYVLYPTGIMLDPHDSSKVVVSMGYQDNDARIVVFDVAKLVDSMEFVSECKPLPQKR